MRVPLKSFWPASALTQGEEIGAALFTSSALALTRAYGDEREAAQ
jgi:hypothetical protein